MGKWWIGTGIVFSFISRYPYVSGSSQASMIVQFNVAHVLHLLPVATLERIYVLRCFPPKKHNYTHFQQFSMDFNLVVFPEFLCV